jgi:peptide/nickel transport system substrate-binding protein
MKARKIGNWVFAHIRRSFPRFSAIVLVAALGVQFSGPAIAQSPVDRRDTLIVEAWPAGTSFRNFSNLNPYAVGNDLRNHVDFVLEPLFYWLNLTGEHLPYLATGYKFNDDFTSVTVTLREGATWSDGKPFSADDVVFTFEMLRKNGEGKNDLVQAKDVATALKEAVKVDDRTIRFDLKARDPRFVLRLLTVKFTTGIFPLPKHVWESVQDPAAFQNLDIAKGFPIGTGPWKVAAALPERIILDRRDDWWGAKPGVWGTQQGAFYTDLPEVKRIITIPRGDPQQSAQLLGAQQIDWMVEAPVPIMRKLLDQFKFITTLTDRKVPYGNVDWWPTALFFNHGSAAVADVNVRKAILHTINAKQIVDVFHEGAAELLHQPFADFKVLKPYIDDLAPLAKERGYHQPDAVKAAGYMEKAGYKKDSAGFWAKDGKRWTAILSGSPALEAIGPIVSEQLRRGGFEANWGLRPDFLQFVFSGKADLVLWGNSGAIFDPEDTMLLYHSKFYRPIGEVTPRFHRWRNDRFDELTNKVGQLPPNDPAIRPLLKEAFTIWMDDVVMVPISQWYHRIPFSTTYWTNWPSEANPYVPPTISAWTSPLVVHGLKKAAR